MFLFCFKIAIFEVIKAYMPLFHECDFFAGESAYFQISIQISDGQWSKFFVWYAII